MQTRLKGTRVFVAKRRIEPALARRRLAGRAALLAGLGAVQLASPACGRDDPLLSADGVGLTFAIESEVPAILVGAVGAPTPDRVAVKVSGRAGSDVSTEGLEVRFGVERGGGRVVAGVARTDAGGVAAVPYTPSGSPDTTVVRAFVAEDPGAALQIPILARPAHSLAGEPGAVMAVPGAADGVLLSIPAGATVDLVPHVTSAVRGRLEYVLRGGEGVFGEGAAATPVAPALAPAVPATATPPLAERPAARDTTLARAGRLPADYLVANCETDIRRFAPLVAEGLTLGAYVDEPEAGDAARAAEILRTFDEDVAPLLQALFGPPVDLDANGRVMAVMSRAMRVDGGVYCGSITRRGREVIYTAWDPSRSAARQLQVLAHEYQHVLNASQHFRWDASGRGSDEAWLNEGLSHVAEWRAGYPDDDLQRTFSFLVRVNAALPLLAERDGTDVAAGRFLFALYLGDRFGDRVYHDLGASGLAGRENLEHVTGIPFRDLLRDWFVTLALAGGSTAEKAWRYLSIDLGGEEARAEACACLPAPRLPGVAFESVPREGELLLVRSLDVQDADFLRFTAGSRPSTLYFTAGGEPDVELFAVRSR